jgi:hypothetical protein
LLEELDLEVYMGHYDIRIEAGPSKIFRQRFNTLAGDSFFYPRG